MTTEEIKKEIFHRNECAKKLFELGKLNKDHEVYRKINKYFNSGNVKALIASEGGKSNTYSELEAIKRQCLLSIVICKYKNGLYNSCITMAERLIKKDPKSIKGYYWLSKSYFELQIYKKAIETIEFVQKLDPNDFDLKQESGLMKNEYRKHIAYKQKEFSEMFS